MLTKWEILDWGNIPQVLKGDVAIVDHRVWQLHQKKLRSLGLPVWVAPPGEEAKTYGSYQECMNFLLELGSLHRGSHLVAIGGGALSDLAGLVAATFLRGISWSILPTTLLSMVDASIGGKVGINTPQGKNLVGAFHSPEQVLVDLSFLQTLPPLERQSAEGEIIKYALLSPEIYDGIHREDSFLIEKCAHYKLELCRKDPFEKKERKFLNLGHTFGHALEKTHHLPHGLAVLWGMNLVFHLFEQKEGLEALLYLMEKRKLELPPLSPPLETNSLIKFIRQDKKKTSSTSLDFVTLEAPGRPSLKTVDFDELKIMTKIEN